jgi:peptide deformylase
MSKQLKIYTIDSKEEEEVLRTKSSPVTIEQMQTPEFKEFLEDLLHTAKNSEEQVGVPSGGIAAPQVGRNLNLFYTLNYDTEKWQLFINPEIKPVGFSKTTTNEGCLSVPNIEEPVMRYKKIKIKYQDEQGNWKTDKYSDFNAVTIQHEKDHLDGILFIDRIE